VVDTCECGNELSGSIKCGELLDWLRTGEVLRKDFVPFFYAAFYYYSSRGTRVLSWR